ncbi:thiamine pyrophosphokinase [Anaerosphaera aminiphila DSM 21120]|uniref:Thiamine diphosphokinase n=1 Tax=Anaerosphaera aminiphila DSM 21120 TaxID=1120995 RepID=A0A1M5T126_9FIRM|nr:thiamine diphosphokinase [Anaerosphaera aminiphila]SHH44376.1 thiamine pyrophosphokinase [Anaerosphaera aminiphila DSM 21120]
MKGLLFAGGNRIREDIINNFIDDSFIVCADSGIKNLVNLNIIPNIVVGDFDSIDSEGRDYISKNNIKVEKYLAEKDFTDTEAALEILLRQNVDEIIIFGATGTRLDHTLASMLLLSKLFGRVRARLIDNHNEVHYVREGIYKFYRKNYSYISLLSVTGELEYSTFGLKYETNHLIVERSSAIGVSNEIKGDSCEITVHRGEGFVIKSID